MGSKRLATERERGQLERQARVQERHRMGTKVTEDNGKER